MRKETVQALDEWQAEIERAKVQYTDSPNAITAMEFSRRAGIVRSTASSRLEQMVREGRATECRKRIARCNGSAGYAKAYKIVKGKK